MTQMVTYDEKINNFIHIKSVFLLFLSSNLLINVKYFFPIHFFLLYASLRTNLYAPLALF